MRVDVRAEKCELRIEKSSKYIIPGPSLCGILSPKDFRGLRPCQQPGIPTGASTWNCLAKVLHGRDCLFSVGLGFLVLFIRLCQTSLEPPHRGWWHPAAEGDLRKRTAAQAASKLTEALWQTGFLSAGLRCCAGCLLNEVSLCWMIQL